MEHRDHFPSFLSDDFLARVTAELNEENVTAIILHGSYVRGQAFPPYSDIDLVRITRESADRREEKQFLYREGYLLSISSRPLSIYRQRFTQPEKAIFVISGIREARILLDKDGEFHKLRQEAYEWTWEPLQAAANAYASQLMVAQTEIALKLLRALKLQDWVALSEMILDLFSAITEAMAVQRGVLVQSGNTYFHQVQKSVGRQSIWTQSHLRIAIHPLSLIERGQEALRLYKETAYQLKSSIHPDHWDVIEQTIYTVENMLSNEEIS